MHSEFNVVCVMNERIEVEVEKHFLLLIYKKMRLYRSVILIF
jgi:hypothetical protein